METGAAGIAALLTVLATIFAIVLGILMLLLPFFIFRIRREVIDMNAKLTLLVERFASDVKPPDSPPA